MFETTLSIEGALKKLHRLAPVVAVGTAVVTLLLCVLCAKIGGKYTGGLGWPYVSDLARDSPSYYLFSLGSLVVSALLATNWAFNFQFQRAVLMEPVDADVAMPRAAHRLLLASLAVGALGMFGLVLVGLFSAASYPAVHSLGAHWFFLLESIAIFLNVSGVRLLLIFTQELHIDHLFSTYRYDQTFISYKIQKFVRSMTDPMSYTINGVNLAPPSPEMLRLLKLQKTFHTQFVFATMYFIAIMLYLPVGLAVVQDFKHLSVAKVFILILACCLKMNGWLGTHDYFKFVDLLYHSVWTETSVNRTAHRPCGITIATPSSGTTVRRYSCCYSRLT